MRAFVPCGRRSLRLIEPHQVRRAHSSLRFRGSTNDSATQHLALGAATTAWLYDNPTALLGPQVEEANSTLVKLVQEAKYGAADRLRHQLQESGVEIQRNPIYREAALAALQLEDPDVCMDVFTAWFSLLPYIDESKSTHNPNPIRDIRNAILRSGSPATRRPLVKRFALLSACKGYIHPLYDEVVNLVARFDTPTEGANFVLHYEEAIRYYHRYAHPEGVKTAGRWYRIAAIEVCCQAGWLDEALQILQLERDFALPDQTYMLLLQSLRDKQHFGAVAVVEHQKSCDESRRDTKGRITSHSQPQGSTSSIPNLYDTQSLRGQKTETALPFRKRILVSRTAVATRLRAVKRVLSASRPPSEAEFFPFLRNAFFAGVTPRTLSILRRKAMSHKGHCATSWVHAELRLYASEGKYKRVISLFIEYFPLSSILSPVFEHTLRRILSAKNLHLPKSVPVPGFKISKHDRWIIYKAIVTLAVDLSQPLHTIRTLYSAYLASATQLKGSPRVFVAFIRAFAYCGSMDEAALVPHDMRTKGLEPNVRQDVALAWAYARVGEVDKAMALLTKIECDVREDGKSRLVMPQLVVYGWVIEGFVQAGLCAQAHRVEERMKRRISYRPGLNRHVDEVLKRLRSDSVD